VKQIKRGATFGQRQLLIGDDRWKHTCMSTWKCGGECEDGLPSPALFIKPSETQQVLERLDALNRLGHGLVSQEVLEELQALPWTVEAGEPRALHLGPSPASNPRTLGTIHQPADMIVHTITDMVSVCCWESNGTVSFDVVVSQTDLFIVVPRIPLCDRW